MKELSYKELLQISLHLQSSFASVHTAEDLYKLNPAKLQDTSCSPVIIKIGPTGDLADIQSPQLLISGEIHGDERVVCELVGV